MHEKTYTFRLADTDVEFVTYRLKAEARVPRPEIKPLSEAGRSAEKARKPARTVNFGEAGKHEATIYDRDMLPPGFSAPGPMVIEEPTSTTIILPGQDMRVDKFGFIHITESKS
jgi:N-methylhydantoinase A